MSTPTIILSQFGLAIPNLRGTTPSMPDSQWYVTPTKQKYQVTTYQPVRNVRVARMASLAIPMTRD